MHIMCVFLSISTNINSYIVRQYVGMILSNTKSVTIKISLNIVNKNMNLITNSNENKEKRLSVINHDMHTFKFT